MALYEPDYTYIDGKKIIDNLPGREGELIRYVFAEHLNREKVLAEKIKEMQLVFNGIRKFSNY